MNQYCDFNRHLYFWQLFTRPHQKPYFWPGKKEFGFFKTSFCKREFWKIQENLILYHNRLRNAAKNPTDCPAACACHIVNHVILKKIPLTGKEEEVKYWLFQLLINRLNSFSYQIYTTMEKKTSTTINKNYF